MYPTTSGTSSPRRVTAQHPFFSCCPNGTALFSVRPDVSLDDALDLASCFLASARDAAYEVADASGGSSAFSAAYLIEMAKAVVDASAMAKPSPAHDLAGTLDFLAAQLADSQKQARQARTAKARNYHVGRVSAFETAITMLRGVDQ